MLLIFLTYKPPLQLHTEAIEAGVVVPVALPDKGEKVQCRRSQSNQARPAGLLEVSPTCSL
jgi:hypothetical protein